MRWVRADLLLRDARTQERAPPQDEVGIKTAPSVAHEVIE